MATQVIMPALGMAQDTGTLIRWLKNEGDPVIKGEPLMEVETDKTTVEIEAAASGTLSRVTAAPGDVIPVAQVIALILAPGESAPKATASLKPVASPVAVRVAEHQKIDLSQITPASGSRISKADVLAYAQAQPIEQASTIHGIPPASPKARRLAAERGIDLATVNGSGPGGAVISADLAAPPEVESAPESAKPLLAVSTAWRVMAERLSASWSSVPHFYLVREVDASRLQAWRSLAQGEPKITITDLLVKLTAAALRQHPRVNSAWNDGGGIVLNEDIHVGLAVATEDALLVPVIHHADQLNLRAIAARRAELVERATKGKLRLDDLQGGTFTLSNLGMYGVDAFNAIINPPQAAILAVGRIRDQVVPVDGQPAVRPMLVLSLSCDHRVIDGARGAQFLDTLAGLIEEPMRLLE